MGPTDTFTFTTPTTAFGFDWFNTDETDQYEVTLSPSGTVFTGPPFTVSPGPAATTGFFGVVSDAPITSITISTDFDGGYISDEGLDNFRVATSGGAGNNSSGTALIWNGNVNGNLDMTTPNFQGSVPYASSAAILFDDTAIGTTNVNVVSNTTTGSLYFTNNTLSYTLSGAPLQIYGTLNISGNSSVTINNQMNISTGMFIYGNGADTFTNALYVRGSMQLSNGGPITFKSNLNVAGGVYISGTGSTSFLSTVNVSSGGMSITTSAPVSFNGPLGVVGPVLLNSASQIGFNASANISGSVTDLGSGTLVFNNPLNVTGSFSLANNPLVQFNSSAVIAGAFNVSPGQVTVTASGVLATSALYVDHNSTFTVLAGGAITGVNGSTMALTGAGPIVLGGNAIIPAGSGTAFTGSLSGTGGLNLSAGYVSVGASNFTLTGPINVGTTAASTAYLSIIDGSGTAGQTSTGSPITVTLAGTGPIGTDNGYRGAINTPDSSNTQIFSGNIIIAPVGAVISSGFQGSLALNGVISGSGPVTFSTNADSLTVLNNVNTYTGETRMVGNVGGLASIDQDILQIGVNNAISTASGINITGSLSQLIVDLNGHNQTVAYLAGGNITSLIINSGNSPSVLTVNTSASTSKLFNGVIQDNGGISLVKTGPGTQTLGGANTYTHGTTVAAGTLIPNNPNAVGTGPITLSGGTLLLPSVGVGNITGFGGFQLNSASNGTAPTVPTITNNVLQLTDTGSNESSSAFAIDTLNSGFTASFLYTPTANGGGTAGATFVIENDPRGASALGANGVSFGYAGAGDIIKSLATLYNPTSKVIGYGTNGTITTTFNPGSSRPAGPPFVSDPLQITLTYNATAHTLTQVLTDTNYNLSNTSTYSINLASVLGGNIAYVGFTGGTGAAGETQTISNFIFNQGGLTNPVSLTNSIGTAPNTSSLLTAPTGGVGSVGPMNLGSGSTLTITGGTSQQKLVLVIPSLSLSGNTGNWTSKLDLTNVNLDLQNASLSDVTNQVKQGFNAGGTLWQGSNGITSSTAAADSTHLTAIGVILNNINGNQLYGTGTALGTFDRDNPASTDVLVKFTYFGDANLDGKVDGSDYSLIDNGILTHQSGWYNGDFNYDGAINGSDYTLIDNAYNTQGASLAASIAGPTAEATAEIASSTAAVPEPAALGIFGIGAVAILRRRRQTAPCVGST